jgi:hypothetical protein
MLPEITKGLLQVGTTGTVQIHSALTGTVRPNLDEISYKIGIFGDFLGFLLGSFGGF